MLGSIAALATVGVLVVAEWGVHQNVMLFVALVWTRNICLIAGIAWAVVRWRRVVAARAGQASA